MRRNVRLLEVRRLAVLRGLPLRQRYYPFGYVPLPPDRIIAINEETRVVSVPIPYIEGFGTLEFAWDGHETTVSGLPVFRWS